jgi:hypothetical protein
LINLYLLCYSKGRDLYEFALMKRKLRAQVSKKIEDAANYKSLLANQFELKEVLCHSAHFKHNEVIFL